MYQRYIVTFNDMSDRLDETLENTDTLLEACNATLEEHLLAPKGAGHRCVVSTNNFEKLSEVLKEHAKIETIPIPIISKGIEEGDKITLSFTDDDAAEYAGKHIKGGVLAQYVYTILTQKVRNSITNGELHDLVNIQYRFM